MRHLDPNRHRTPTRARAAVGVIALLSALSLVRAQEAHAIACGDRIAPGSTVVLTADLGPCATAAALEIEGPATLDLGGHTITCTGATPTTGVRVLGRGVKVAGGTIARCQVGVSLAGSRHRIADLAIDLPGNAGIASSGVTSTRIENVDVDRAGIGGGVRLVSSDQRVTLRDVRVFGASRDGFVIRGERHRLDDCRAFGMSRAGYDIGGRGHVIVDSGALQNRPFDPEVAADGFVVANAAQVKLVRNEATQNNGRGYRIVLSEGVKLDRNLARRNGSDGFVVSSSEAIQLRRSTVTENGGDGIRVAGGVVDVIVAASEASGHQPPAFDLRSDDPFCAETRWLRNVFSSASASCVR